ncbi:MAG: hypothetical protein JO038_09950 [Alphaproteobacteria bacterium]|nr:hypothetical protein [Alphaproteobacteria bacterium]
MPPADSKLHMAVTNLFDGGVVNNANIASQIAQMILKSLIEQAELLASMPLRVEDRGDRWQITGNRGIAGSDEPGVGPIEVRKHDSAILAPRAAGNLLGDAAIAEKFAAKVLANIAGRGELRRQRPLVAEDNGDSWRVRGSANAKRTAEGPGPFELLVQKCDARVLDMWFEWVLNTPPDVQSMLQASARKPGRGM